MPLLDYHRTFLDTLPVAVYACIAPTGTLLYWNQRAVEFWGREPVPGDLNERFCGSHKLYWPTGEYLAHEDCPMAVAIRTGQTFTNQPVVIEHPDGTRVTALVNIAPLRDEQGAIVGAVNVFQRLDADAEQRLRGAGTPMGVGHGS